jgi:hypothetical protein
MSPKFALIGQSASCKDALVKEVDIANLQFAALGVRENSVAQSGTLAALEIQLTLTLPVTYGNSR